VSEWYWKFIGETGRDNIPIVIESMIILWCGCRNVNARNGEW